MKQGFAISPAEQRRLLTTLCTAKEAEAYELANLRGYSIRAAANHLNISPAALRDRLKAADKKITTHSRNHFPASHTEPPPHIRKEIDPLISLLIQRDGPHCYLCNTELHDLNASLDHIIPTSIGGTHTAENLAIACMPCNLRKSASIVSVLTTSGRPVYHLRQGKGCT